MDIIKRIKEAGIERDEERKIYVAGLLNEALGEFDIRVTVVGGSIVAFLTAGHYTTADVDIVAKNPEKVRQVLEDIGFKRVDSNRFVHEKLGMIIDYMGQEPLAERLDTIKIKEVEVDIISIEDILVDRLKMLDKGIDVEKSNTLVKIIVYLLEKQLDEEYLRNRLIKENLWDLWTRIKAEVDEYGP
jgi:predicted nucleotidyltransferase